MYHGIQTMCRKVPANPTTKLMYARGHRVFCYRGSREYRRECPAELHDRLVSTNFLASTVLGAYVVVRQDSTKKAVAKALAEARHVRRQRKLDQIEIHDDHLTTTDELLGKGGFGAVYLADYNGRNAAAKVVVRPPERRMDDKDNAPIHANFVDNLDAPRRQQETRLQREHAIV